MDRVEYVVKEVVKVIRELSSSDGDGLSKEELKFVCLKVMDEVCGNIEEEYGDGF